VEPGLASFYTLIAHGPSWLQRSCRRQKSKVGCQQPTTAIFSQVAASCGSPLHDPLHALSSVYSRTQTALYAPGSQVSLVLRHRTHFAVAPLRCAIYPPPSLSLAPHQHFSATSHRPSSDKPHLVRPKAEQRLHHGTANQAKPNVARVLRAS
jgi:hypothetical protein